MGGAGQAEVVGAEGHLHVVEHGRRHITILDEMLGRLFHRQIDRGVVVGGGHDQVGVGDNALVIGAVVVDEGTARCLDDAHALARTGGRLVPGVLAGDLGITGQLEALFGGVEQLNGPGPVVGQDVMHRLGTEGGMELLKMLLRQGGIHTLDDVHPRQRPNRIDVGARTFDNTLPGTDLLLVGEFQIRPRLHALGDKIEILLAFEAAHRVAGRVDDLLGAVVVGDVVVLVHRAHVADLDLVHIAGDQLHILVVFQHHILKDLEGQLAQPHQLLGPLLDLLALLLVELLGPAAGDGCHRMVGLTTEEFKDLHRQTATAQDLTADIGAHCVDQANDVAHGGIGLRADDKVRQPQSIENHRVILDIMGIKEQFA